MIPKISIIMGIYNCEETLKESLNSIVNQTYDNWEMIMCDDGSSDSTLEIAKQYQMQYPKKVRVIQNEKNLGLNATLNKCLQLARGEYIARQDGDDISLPERFELEKEFLDKHREYAFVSSNMSFFDESGVWGEWKNPERPQRIDFLRQSPCFCHAPCMIRREAFMDVHGYTEKQRYLRCEDVNLWYKLYAKGYKGYNIQKPLYMMRDDQNAYKRRTVSNRINIILTEWDGMRSLNCKFAEYRFFVKKVIKNLIAIVMPEGVYKFFHKKRLNS